MEDSKRRKCFKCDGFIRKIPMDNGRVFVEEKKKPGRPPKDLEPPRERYEDIGYWCKRCRIFHYLDEDVPMEFKQVALDIW